MNEHEPPGAARAGDPAELDEALVASVLGKRMLIGLTYVKHAGDVIEQRQLHGIVERTSTKTGIVPRLPNGSTYRLPPDLRGIERAPRGIYRLRPVRRSTMFEDTPFGWGVNKSGWRHARSGHHAHQVVAISREEYSKRESDEPKLGKSPSHDRDAPKRSR